MLAARNNSIAAKKQIEFTVECSELLFIESYDSILSEVISNLLRNAIAHAFEASNKNQQILLKAHAIKESIMILVIDNGKGIESTLQDKIFQPFVTSRRIDGFSGLGLHLVFNLVTQLLMGRIDLSSEINHGSTFTLTLPSNVHKKQLHNLN